MQTTTYGKEDAKTVLIQMVDDHDLEEIFGQLEAVPASHFDVTNKSRF